MTFEKYSESAAKTAIYPDHGENIVYPALGLAGEAGEVANKVKKLWRDFGITSQMQFDGHAAMLSQEQFDKLQKLRGGILKEIGGCLWYLAMTAQEMGSSLEECANQNNIELAGRAERGTIGGSGDER